MILEFYSAVLQENKINAYFNLHLLPAYFRQSETPLFQFFNGHCQQYGSLPSINLVNEFLAGTTGDFLPPPENCPEFYRDQLRNRFIVDSLKEIAQETKQSLATKDPEAVLATHSDRIINLHLEASGTTIIDFRDAADHIVKEYKSKLLQGSNYGINMGWPYLDDMCGGLQPGDVVSYLGRPAAGKTFMMLYSAHHAWYNQGKRTLLISMEMKPIILEQRVAAMHTHYNLTKLKNAAMSTSAFNKVVKELTLLKGHPEPLYIVDGNLTATIEDIWRLCRQLKPEVVYIDGAYLVRTKDKMSRWDKIAYVAENLKAAIAGDIGTPCVASYQFGRDVVKKAKKNEEPGLEDIFGGDAVGQVSSVVIGFLEDDSVETLIRRRADILKGRSGEVGRFYIKWRFDSMDFGQWTEEKLESLQFV